ncbi:PREDICTED: uncharacterized protein LOC104826522 isoform X2 [Tarenaya hassleriana]|uniref:uncharacterized protein LOC104826522 isoform X2 n=1 Tax=Tarenaya hassleriana TaxID=28532 RepID=UPI00053C312D|nr:PREDICTED: uncharacterized protein LOC104826522 isoform X2 [Tarenaya hassleriana]
MQLNITPRGMKQAMPNGNMMCSLQSGFGGIPWVDEFSFVNGSAVSHEIGGVNLAFGQTCTFEHFERFSSFFSKLIDVSKEFSLPPEKHRFGLVTERSLVSSLGVGESDSWLAVLQLAGCPHCSKNLKVDKDIERLLKMENPIFRELDDDGQEFESSLPASKPSVILFVDRSCGSLKERRRIKNALGIFREVAAQHQTADIIKGEDDVHPEKSVNQVDKELRTMFGPSRLETSPKFKKITLENKVSVMILDGDKNVALDNIASDLEGSSLHEILTNLLHRTKETKLSSIAKDVGFRLLSDDANIKILDTLPSQAEYLSGHDSSSSSLEGLSGSTLHHDETKLSDVKLASTDVLEKHGSEQSVMMETDKHEVSATKTVKIEINTSLQSDSKEDSVQTFTGSFFFSDGNYPLLNALTGNSKLPSAVIIDPPSQQHYVFQDEFSHASFADFLHGYLNGSLLPYKKSQSIIQIPRKVTPPPFVNLDFHEVDAIPRVTVNTFSELVGVLDRPTEENAYYPRRNDVLVLFSNSWCGFCQRMGLVVREVYRSLKGYTESIKRRSRDNQMLVSSESLANGGSIRPPLIYFMDCMLNDCSLILKSMNQREVFPALALFPAGRKEAIPYEGDISVADIIGFLARYGNSSREFLSKKGILLTPSGKQTGSSSMFDQSFSAANEKATGNDKLFEVTLRNRKPKSKLQQNEAKPQPPTHSHKPVHHVKVGTFLIASDKLVNAHPFDNSRILIVKADPEIGFQGLIVNKHLRWDSYPELTETVVDLLKEAPLSFGGPVADPGIPLSALTRGGKTNNHHAEILTGVCFLDQSAVAHLIKDFESGGLTPSDYWFFLGYSSWNYHQLFDEIEQGVWDVENDETNFAWP